jgi:hypothetical protein
MADATDLKSDAGPSKTPENPDKPTESPGDLRNACANDTTDPELKTIVDAWQHLPADVRRTIVSVVRLSVPTAAC